MKITGLSPAQKLQAIRTYRSCRNEEQYAEEYAHAVEHNDTETIAHYEQFGTEVRQIIMNKHSYELGKRFGFTAIKFDPYGWLKNARFEEVEEIEFTHKKGWASHNSVTIGKGANGLWTFGRWFSTGGYGCANGMGITGRMFDNREDCLKAALQEIIDGHNEAADRYKDQPANFNPGFSRNIVKQVQEMLDYLTGRKLIQLSLFN